MFALQGRYAAWLFIAPAVLAVVVFVYLPMVLNVGVSFYDWNVLRGDFTWRGTDNYVSTMENIDFQSATTNTAIYLAVLVPLKIVIPLVLAFTLLRVRNPILVRAYRAIYFIPTIVSFSIAGVVWLWMFNPIVGFLNTLLEAAGLPTHRWINDPDLAIWCVTAVAFWKGFGLNLILYAAALVNIPGEVLEAAELDGANAWVRAFRIELPMISPTLFFTAITTVLIVMDEIVGVVDVLTEGGPFNTSSNLVYFLYERAFRQFNFGEAAAVATIIIALVALVTWLQFKVFERYVHYQ
ncbi:multiple sugar transport system permease protein/sn-glycerol 3-phosphate transport system permease protein [Stella humosa]|uniref:Multiple sugar transport system permease protein/sn-glycerol 3-phosphate transport system permease protein n=1 Tax=Stella humosa TaxID=94 RepID=A0A3N1KRD6_9PROT|nr:sugar ABC transporter permease [Stella humosa]ROP83161.1 multiple sugar transport system permease protein/sn-glycerol 3-phosphate transport system permease protein [Stella humosa]BBK30062.1 ABC transporter permease [Stella humosa]